MITETIIMSDGAGIHTGRFEPGSAARGVVQFVHGFGEHLGRYKELAGRFTDKSFVFVSHDQRGHGQTAGRRGVAGYESFLSDVDAVRDRISEWYPGLPVILYGHSMGGNIALNYLLNRSQTRHMCAVIGSPWLRLYKPVSRATTILARILGSVSVNLTISNKLVLEHLTHDAGIVASTTRDKAYHSNLSFRLFGEISLRGEQAIARASEITLPTLLLCAGQDMIVCPKAIAEFASKSVGAVTLRSYPEQYHELHNEINREAVFEDVLRFIEEHSG